MDIHNVVEIVGASGVLAIAKLLWNAGASFTSIQKDMTAVAKDVADLKSNHLPHLEEKIDRLQDSFIDHVQLHGGK